MDKDFNVVKFGEKYFKEMSIVTETIMLTLVNDLTNAKKYKDLDRGSIQRLLDLGGSIVEVSIREYDRTFSLEREWEEEDAAIQTIWTKKGS